MDSSTLRPQGLYALLVRVQLLEPTTHQQPVQPTYRQTVLKTLRLRHQQPAQSFALQPVGYLPPLVLARQETHLNRVRERYTPPSQQTVLVKYSHKLLLELSLVTSLQQAFAESGKLEVLKVTSQQPVFMATLKFS
jgi:hypothetical protein